MGSTIGSKPLTCIFNLYMFFSTARQLIILVAMIIYLRRRSALVNLGELEPELIDQLSKEDFSYQTLVMVAAHYRDLHCAGVVCAAVYFHLCMFFYYFPIFYDKFKHRKFLSDAHSSTTYNYIRHPEKYYTAIRDWRNNFKLKLLMSSKFFFSQLNQNPRVSVDFAKEQSSHMLECPIEACSFEPQNRNSEWIRKLNRIWLLLQFLLIYDYLCAIGISIYAKEFFFRVKKETNLSQWDRLSMLEESIFQFFGTYLFSSPLVKLMLNEIDMNRLLVDLTNRMSQLVMKLKHSKELYFRTNDYEAERFLNRAKMSCNREALQVYVFFRYFVKEQAKHQRLANLIISQYLSYLSCVVFTLLSVVKCLKKDDSLIVAVVIIMMCSFTNCVFILCASTNSKCIRATQMAWQLIANSQQTEKPARIEKQLRLSSFRPMQPERFEYLISKPEKELTYSCLCDVQDNLVAHLVDAHTRFLWFRLVQDRTQVSEIFTYTTLGFYQMDYNSMIQYNFWLISIMMATYMRDWV